MELNTALYSLLYLPLFFLLKEKLKGISRLFYKLFFVMCVVAGLHCWYQFQSGRIMSIFFAATIEVQSRIFFSVCLHAVNKERKARRKEYLIFTFNFYFTPSTIHASKGLLRSLAPNFSVR